MNSAYGDVISPLKTSFENSTPHNHSSMTSNYALTHKVLSTGQDFVNTQSQDVLPSQLQSLNELLPVQVSVQTRNPKAPTLSAKFWGPHHNRIKELYVTKRNSIEDLRSKMNSELGITATLRQYKVLIEKMKLERNVKATERTTIVKHIRYRNCAVGKKSRLVRVRGHEISLKKLLRWEKDNLIGQPSNFDKALSNLPSCISIYTNSVCGPPGETSVASFKDQRLVNESMIESDIDITFEQRLFKYAHCPDRMMESENARKVFNDIQLLFNQEYTIGKAENEDGWNPCVEGNIVQVRNFMNLTQTLFVSRELKHSRQLMPVTHLPDEGVGFYRRTNRHATWTSPYGKIQASFWVVSNEPKTEDGKDTMVTIDETVAARLVITPHSTEVSVFSVFVDFAPHLDPSATITYQAMIPSTSKIFTIASHGGVQELMELLGEGIASLTDRDEDGRSLLNYAVTYLNLDMCKFLVKNNADVNAIECSESGNTGPVHSWLSFISAAIEDKHNFRRNQCHQILLEAGADFSLELNLEQGLWLSAFMYAIIGSSLVMLRQILEIGGLFISLNDISRSSLGEFSPLTLLVQLWRRNISDKIDVADKAILLIERKADLFCRDEFRDSVLHTIFRCPEYLEGTSESLARRLDEKQRWELSSSAPKDLLMVFITAGADVYALNDYNETPSMVAASHGRQAEWIEALELCGYDSEEVLSCCAHVPTRENQKSKLPFHEYCKQRQLLKHHCSGRHREVESDNSDDESLWSEEDSDDEDSDAETRVVAADIVDNADVGDDFPGTIDGVDCADHSFERTLDNQDGGQTHGTEHLSNSQNLEIATNLADDEIQGRDVDWNEWLDDGMDFLQNFDDYGTFQEG